MIAAVITGVALISTSGDYGQPVKLAPKAACRLATASGVPSGRTYSIAGTYFADGMHGSTFDLSECDVGLRPELQDAALTRVSGFHQAFQQKCGSWLNGDHIVGVFTGHLVQRRTRLFGMSAPTKVNFFVITDVETADEDPVSITCPK